MNKQPITSLQRNLGDISNALIRGESIILTRNGKDFAKLSPIEERALTPQEQARLELQEIRDKVNAGLREKNG